MISDKQVEALGYSKTSMAIGEKHSSSCRFALPYVTENANLIYVCKPSSDYLLSLQGLIQKCKISNPENYTHIINIRITSQNLNRALESVILGAFPDSNSYLTDLTMSTN